MLSSSLYSRRVLITSDLQLSIIVEFIAGKVTDSIDRLIALYRPDSLIVGTRGLKGVRMLGATFGGMGSVSKYVLFDCKYSPEQGS